MHNRQPVSPKELLNAILDYDLWPVYVIRILSDIGSGPVLSYLTLTLRKLGFSTFNTNALTIPANMLLIIVMVFTGWISEVINERSYILSFSSIWVLACLFPLRYWPGSQINVWGTYAILIILLGHNPVAPLSISWTSANSNSVRSRAVSGAIVNIFSQTGSIAASNIYRMDDAPLYHRGNEQLIAIAFGALAACLLAKVYYIQRNKYKERKWSSMTVEEQEYYISNSTDSGNKRLDFRFVH